MSQGCAILILRSRSWGKDDWKWFLDHNWSCNPPIFMKLNTLAPYGSRMCSNDFGAKGQRSWGISDWKRFPDHNWLCNPPMSMELHTPAPYESRMCLWFKTGFKCITASPLHLSVWNFTSSLPMSQVCALWNLGSKGQGHNARITENGFWRITASPLHQSLWNFTCSLPMSQVWTLWTLGSKGQGHNARITENGFKCITASLLHLSS